jgi:hypothetical protein
MKGFAIRGYLFKERTVTLYFPKIEYLGATDGQKLIFSIDLLAKNHCEIYRRTMRDDSSTAETQAAVNSLLATYTSSSADAFLSETLGTQKPATSTTPTTTTPTTTSAPALVEAKKDLKGLDYRDIINREINAFRDGSVRHDLARQKDSEEARRRLQARMKRDEEASVGAVRELDDVGPDDYDSEEEGRKREKKRREDKDRFLEREERWLKYETERERKRDKEHSYEKETREKKEFEGKKMRELLAHFDDDESAKHEFNTDRYVIQCYINIKVRDGFDRGERSRLERKLRTFAKGEKKKGLKGVSLILDLNPVIEHHQD